MLILFIALVIVVLFFSLSSVQKMVVIVEGNKELKALPMELHKYQDSDCGMVIDDLTYASQVVVPSGKTWFFHDHGGFVHWLKDKNFKDEAVIWVMSRDTHKWIDAKTAFYSRNETTPMGYGFGAYEESADGRVSYDEMQLLMLRGETLNNPLVRRNILGE